MANKKENVFMKTWNLLKTVPDSAKKKIDAGRQKGLTSINPTWQKQKMTEVFGPIGQGWKVNFERWPNEYCEATGETIVVFKAHVFVRYPETDEWTEEVQGFGSSKLCSKEKGGIFFDDDAFKKAATDALGNALQYFGVGADVRFLNTEENKYTAPKNIVPIEGPQNVANNLPIPPVLNGTDVITPEQAKHLETVCQAYGKTADGMLGFVNVTREEKAETLADITYDEYSTLLRYFH